MTPEQYATMIEANRLLGHIQVRQLTRQLAQDYGAPDHVLDPRALPHRPVRAEPGADYGRHTGWVRRDARVRWRLGARASVA